VADNFDDAAESRRALRNADAINEARSVDVDGETLPSMFALFQEHGEKRIASGSVDGTAYWSRFPCTVCDSRKMIVGWPMCPACAPPSEAFWERLKDTPAPPRRGCVRCRPRPASEACNEADNETLEEKGNVA